MSKGSFSRPRRCCGRDNALCVFLRSLILKELVRREVFVLCKGSGEVEGMLCEFVCVIGRNKRSTRGSQVEGRLSKVSGVDEDTAKEKIKKREDSTSAHDIYSLSQYFPSLFSPHSFNTSPPLSPSSPFNAAPPLLLSLSLSS